MSLVVDSLWLQIAGDNVQSPTLDHTLLNQTMDPASSAISTRQEKSRHLAPHTDCRSVQKIPEECINFIAQQSLPVAMNLKHI